MASSSVSQESLDREDYELSARRSRVRTHPLRTRTAPHKPVSVETTGTDEQEQNGDKGADDGVFESPTRASASSRSKEKRAGRPNHLNKGKTAREKRKLREKRRSTGVVQLPSTESTGDSLDEEEKHDGRGDTVTRKNTSYNEVIDADNPQTPEEERKKHFESRRSRNKSPSDLEADLEDNQDYDSTVSQSETNLTTIGQVAPPQPTASIPSRHPPSRSSPDKTKSQLSSRSSPAAGDSHGHSSHTHSRPVSYQARFKGEHELDNITSPHSGPKSPRQRHKQYAGGSNVCDSSSKTSGEVPTNQAKLLARTAELEQLLEKQFEENEQLRERLADKDNTIAQLEKEVQLLSKDLEEVDFESEKLTQENRALMKALASLDT